MEARGSLLHHIFKIFTHVQRLQFYPDVPNACSRVLFADRPSMFSSTLVEFHINIYSFELCLDVFDGRFPKLRILVVDTGHISSLQRHHIDTASETHRGSPSVDCGVSVCFQDEAINNLKESSLSCCHFADADEEVLLPTLQQMIDLKKFSLSADQLSTQIHRWKSSERECYSSDASTGRFRVEHSFNDATEFWSCLLYTSPSPRD